MKESLANFGLDEVSEITGVPADSHFARVMVAADYLMKRLAMGLEPSPTAAMRSPRIPTSAERAARYSSSIAAKAPEMASAASSMAISLTKPHP